MGDFLLIKRQKDFDINEVETPCRGSINVFDIYKCF
jgi:hypothetical protein